MELKIEGKRKQANKEEEHRGYHGTVVDEYACFYSRPAKFECSRERSRSRGPLLMR